MVKVAHGLFTDSLTAQTKKMTHKATLESIARLRGGRPIPETEEDVPESGVNEQGRYIPKKDDRGAMPLESLDATRRRPLGG